ncbi:helicase HerA domain-containing protein [Micromonospora sp. DT47]|uniref:helicase HerA domain-containing protein n=1 Tax=Micromonospora sp. DT47 TaxID=3393431 RepID=UPI003CEB43F2
MTMPIGSARAQAEMSPLNALLDGLDVGRVFDIDFRGATVVTNDAWKRGAGGIPEFCFLLATVRQAGVPAGNEDDDEVLLLRVEGTAPVPRQSELTEIREAAARHEAVWGDAAPDAAAVTLDSSAVPIDNLTRDRMQYSGLRCRILGTFYADVTTNGVPYLAFGSDLDNLYAATSYRVFKPSPAALEIIASYPSVTEAEAEAGAAPQLLPIGHVRYASTRRRAKLRQEHEVPVAVRVGDFIEQKTAIFGMTRTGKSNTVKTLTTAVFRHACENGERIGQLLFDPQGEYANVNQQDGTALADLGDEYVSIYRYGLRAGEPGRALQLNFFDPEMLEPARQVIADVLLAGAGNAKYITRFVSADLSDPDPADYPNPQALDSAKQHIARARMFFYALLAKASFPLPQRWSFTMKMAAAIADRIITDTQAGITKVNGGRVTIRTRQDLIKVCEWLVEHKDEGSSTTQGTIAYWLREEATQAVMGVFESSTNRAGIARMRDVAPFHNPHADGNFALDIYDELSEGKIVIVELSRGTQSVLQAISERIIMHVLDRGGEVFRRNEEPPKMQIVIEEAHTLFEKSKFGKQERDPYVLLARTASKLKIGLMYATQEVRSVADEVLSNTYNWIVAHLNSKHEVNELSKYYDFESFGDAIRGSEDRGFVRLKTMSGRYIVPVQIAKFDVAMITAARTTAEAAQVVPPGLPSGDALGPAAPAHRDDLFGGDLDDRR